MRSKGERVYENQTYPDFDVSHKVKCKKCVYHGTLGGGFSMWNIICQYILIKNERRPCPANACTVFVEGPAKRTSAGEYYIHNLG